MNTTTAEPDRAPAGRKVPALVTLVVLAGIAVSLAVVSGRGSAATATGSLDPAVVAELSEVGVTMKATSDDSAVSAFAATSAAVAGVPLLDGAKSGAADLVIFTDTQRGTEGSDGTITPTSVDGEGWVIVFSDASIPLLGPPGTRGGFRKSDTAVFVDAKTGVFLQAIAFGAQSS